MRKTFHRSSIRFQQGNPLKAWLALMILVLVVQATPADKVALPIQVYDPSGAVVAGAIVIWESGSKPSRSLKTNLEGKALFARLPAAGSRISIYFLR
jgi:hypothetical protein